MKKDLAIAFFQECVVQKSLMKQKILKVFAGSFWQDVSTNWIIDVVRPLVVQQLWPTNVQCVMVKHKICHFLQCTAQNMYKQWVNYGWNIIR